MIAHDTEEDDILLQIYQTQAGQWAGRLVINGEEVGGCAGLNSPEEVEEAVTDNGIIPNRIEMTRAPTATR